MMKTASMLLIGLLGPLTSAAWADGAADAYKRGKDAMKAGKVHDACPAFEESEKLEAKVDTELALADCYEQDGKPVAAAKIYRTAADKDTKADRKKTSLDKATKLEAKAPKLRITLSQRPDGLVIKVDGVEVPSTGDVMVDAGPHEVIATAPGFSGHANAAVDKDRAIVDVIVRMEATAEAKPPEPPPTTMPTEPKEPPPTTTATAPVEDRTPPPPHEEAPPNHRRRNAEILGGLGVAALVGSVITFSVSSSRFDDEHGLCPGSVCGTQADLDHARSLLDDGHFYRGLSIGLGIGGVALVGFGAYLFFTHPAEETHVTMQVGHGSASVGWTGRF